MPVAIAASLLGLITVLIAFYRDEPVAHRPLVAPDWGLLPDPGELSRLEFPLAFSGYDPASVEFHFDLLARAYADLYAAATPEVIGRARHRAALRHGLEPDTPAPTVVPDSPEETSLTPLVVESGDVEALRAEAALAQFDEMPHPPATQEESWGTGHQG